MPLIKKDDIRRIAPEWDAEEWFMVHPIAAGDYEGLMITEGSDTVRIGLDLMNTLIDSWGYPEPKNREWVGRIDPKTFGWLNEEVLRLSGIRDEAEKKGSNSDSPSTTDPEEAPSHKPSPTSLSAAV